MVTLFTLVLKLPACKSYDSVVSIKLDDVNEIKFTRLNNEKKKNIESRKVVSIKFKSVTLKERLRILSVTILIFDLLIIYSEKNVAVKLKYLNFLHNKYRLVG